MSKYVGFLHELCVVKKFEHQRDISAILGMIGVKIVVEKREHGLRLIREVSRLKLGYSKMVPVFQ